MKKYFFLFTVTISLSGCIRPLYTLSENNLYADDYDQYSDATSVLLLPVVSDHASYKTGEKVVLDEVTRQLSVKFDLDVMPMERYLKLWSEITDSIGGIYSKKTGKMMQNRYYFALKELVKRANHNKKYSMTLFPSLVIRNAELKGKLARWDGVKRNIVAEWFYLMDMDWSGGSLGLSLQVIAFDSEEKWISTSYGGLVLPLRTVEKKGAPVSEVRQDMFEEADNIESGVRVALLPVVDRKLTSSLR